MALILLVEDSSFARKMTGNILKKAGHEVVEAEDGLKGLELLEARTPDCIVSDILMPLMDGHGFLEALRENGNRIPVIMLTADVQEKTRQECLELGALEILHKPAQEASLLQAIGKALKEEV
jgi:two-component system chemotaxis response regulator CheY